MITPSQAVVSRRARGERRGTRSPMRVAVWVRAPGGRGLGFAVPASALDATDHLVHDGGEQEREGDDRGDHDALGEHAVTVARAGRTGRGDADRKSTRLNSSH